MIQDARADIVFSSDRLPDRHPAMVDGLGRILEGHGIPLGLPAARGLPAVLDLPVRAVGAAVPAGVVYPDDAVEDRADDKGGANAPEP